MLVVHAFTQAAKSLLLFAGGGCVGVDVGVLWFPMSHLTKS